MIAECVNIINCLGQCETQVQAKLWRAAQLTGLREQTIRRIYYGERSRVYASEYLAIVAAHKRWQERQERLRQHQAQIGQLIGRLRNTDADFHAPDIAALEALYDGGPFDTA